MKTAVLFATIALATLGCRKASLGPDSGNAVQEAIAAQRASSEEGKARGISAEDAKMVLHVHRNGPQASAGPSLSGAGSSGYGASPLMSSPGSVTSSGSAAGSGDGIHLRAK